MITLLHPGDRRSDSLVTQAAGEYKRRFAQEAVLREKSLTCSRF